MKKIILALATLPFMGSAATKAQVTKVTVRSISGNSKEEVENIDNAKYRITYEGKWVNNPSIKPFIYTDSEMRLDIGEKATSFYDRTKQVKDSLMNEKPRLAISTSQIYLKVEDSRSPTTRTIHLLANPSNWNLSALQITNAQRTWRHPTGNSSPTAQQPSSAIIAN